MLNVHEGEIQMEGQLKRLAALCDILSQICEMIENSFFRNGDHIIYSLYLSSNHSFKTCFIKCVRIVC